MSDNNRKLPSSLMSQIGSNSSSKADKLKIAAKTEETVRSGQEGSTELRDRAPAPASKPIKKKAARQSVPYSIRLDPEVHDYLVALADEMMTTPSRLGREAVNAWVEQHKAKKATR